MKKSTYTLAVVVVLVSVAFKPSHGLQCHVCDSEDGTEDCELKTGHFNTAVNSTRTCDAGEQCIKIVGRSKRFSCEPIVIRNCLRTVKITDTIKRKESKSDKIKYKGDVIDGMLYVCKGDLCNASTRSSGAPILVLAFAVLGFGGRRY